MVDPGWLAAVSSRIATQKVQDENVGLVKKTGEGIARTGLAEATEEASENRLISSKKEKQESESRGVQDHQTGSTQGKNGGETRSSDKKQGGEESTMCFDL
ncbi:MAG: hypothetical protein ABEK59_04760 [Halobacteria archaeon]